MEAAIELRQPDDIVRSLRPLRDHVIVRLLERKERLTDTNLWVPPPSALGWHECREAVVLAVGPGTYNERGVFVPNQLRPGQHVLVNPRIGVELYVDRIEYEVHGEKHVVAVTED